MPEYPGPWIQAPDYEKPGETALGVDLADIGYGAIERGGLGSTSGDVQGAQATAAAGGTLITESDPLASVGGGLTGNVKTSVEFTIAPDLTTTESIVHFTPRSISPYTKGVINWAPFLLGVPEGAVGWQWQEDLSVGGGKPSSPLGAVWYFVADEDNMGETSSGGLEPVAGGWTTGVFYSPGTTYTSDTTIPGAGDIDYIDDWAGTQGFIAGVAGPNGGVNTAVDITDYLDDMGRVCVGVRPVFEDTLAEDGSSIPGVAPQVPLDLTVESDMGYGYAPASFPEDVLWTFRPPVFRWLYNTPQTFPVAPPQRIFPPRGDGLAGGARRLWPPPKSRQRSSRHGRGSIL